MSCFCYSTTVSSTNSKTSAAMQATVIIAPTIATALVRRRRHRQSLRIRSYCLFPICKPSDDLSCHLVHPRNQMHALTRAWLNTSAMSSSETFASPLSTPIHGKTTVRVTCLSFQTRICRRQLGFRDSCCEPKDRECKAKSTRKWRSPQSSWR
jgi:hypothetical protein